MDKLKRLIFYLYITEDFFERKTNLVTMECLRRYSKIFDCADFYLSIDDVHNYELINRVENIIINLGFDKDISFKIHQNNEYRESAIVKSEIVDKLDTRDEVIFFGHGKGFTNLETYEENSMIHWLLGCYYLSLEFADEAMHLITGMNTFSAYGSFPLLLEKRSMEDDYLAQNELYLGRIKYGWCYSGTFFWLNVPKLYDHMQIFKQNPPKIFDRYYSEKFLGNVMSYNSNATGHNLRFLFSGNNMYNDGVAEECIKFVLNEDEQPAYYQFREEILNAVKERYGK